MRLSAIVRSYHNTDFLVPVLRQFDWIDKVLVVNCLHEGYEDAPDNTKEIVGELAQPNVQLMQLYPAKEHEVLNIAIAHLQEYDRIFICDADEMMSKEDWKKITRLGHYDCGLCKMVDIMPNGEEQPREHMPVMVVKPDCHFYFQRCVVDNCKMFENVTMEHYGYLVKDLEWKKRNYTKLGMDEPIK